MCACCVGQIMVPDWIEKKRMTIVNYIIIIIIMIIIIIIIIMTIISITITTINVVAIVVNNNVGCLSSAIHENKTNAFYFTTCMSRMCVVIMAVLDKQGCIHDSISC